MKKVFVLLLVLCLVPGGFCTASGDGSVQDVPMAMSITNGVSGNTAFALPGSAGLYPDVDMPG